MGFIYKSLDNLLENSQVGYKGAGLAPSHLGILNSSLSHTIAYFPYHLQSKLVLCCILWASY